MDRRKLLQWSGAASALGAATALPERAAAAPASSSTSALGLDAAQMGVRPGSPDDQSAAMQRAIDRAAAARVPLALPPGVYRVAALKLPAGAQVIGMRGATRLVYGGGAWAPNMPTRFSSPAPPSKAPSLRAPRPRARGYRS